MPEPAKIQRYRVYREAWRRRDEEAKTHREQRRKEALDAALRCARILIERFGARRVYLFGSVLDPARFHDASDIDLAVEGLQPGLTYWRALVELWPELPQAVTVDLVPLEQADPGLVSEIVSRGRLLEAS